MRSGFGSIDAVGAFFGGLIGALFGAVLFLFGAVVWYVVKLLVVKPAIWVYGALTPQAPASSTLKQFEVEQEQTALAAHSVESARSIRVVTLTNKAVLHLKCYEGEAKPTVVWKTKALRERFGNRMQLESIDLSEHSETEAQDIALEKVKALIDGVKQLKGTREQRSGGETETIHPEPDKAAPAPTKAPAEPEKRRLPKQGDVSYIGKLVRAGVETRKGVKEPYDCYCVTIFDYELGTENQLWGTDLERAMIDSNASPGERVKVSMIGETPVSYKGRKNVKKVWSIEKIAA